MTRYRAEAEFDTLRSLRVHRPGFETFVGSLDHRRHGFPDPLSVSTARAEHDELVAVLEGEGLEVRYLHDDLDGVTLDSLLGDSVSLPDQVRTALAEMSPADRLTAVATGLRATLDGHQNDPEIEVAMSGVASNLYFQRDDQLLADRSPVVCRPYSEVRVREMPLVRAGWESLGEDPIVAGPEPIEGGDFLPLDEFALLMVSAALDGEEHVLRTSVAAGEALLESGALGYEEVGLVRAPLEADRREAASRGRESRLMHLDGWCNVPAEGLAVVRESLAEEATVEVYRREGDGYRHDRTERSLLAYLRRKEYETIDAPYDERWATNFLTIDDGTVVAVAESTQGTEGQTIRRMREAGIEVVPDGVGMRVNELTKGGGAVHCMTQPIART
ncbi:arginine deiminase family protein [Natronorarus salvus]|uniref:arginine deiminase family protein n=1 Tax=Natronorarus salvus TaxID=3117733 RepID=UPI002F25F218